MKKINISKKVNVPKCYSLKDGHFLVPRYDQEGEYTNYYECSVCHIRIPNWAESGKRLEKKGEEK